MSNNRYIRIAAPESVGDHELPAFKARIAADFAAGARKAGAVIERLGVDETYGPRVLAARIRGEMNPSQERVIAGLTL